MFTDQTKLPKFINYKIRMDADKVDSTKRIEDRLSRPGPRRRPGIDLKYLYYGFAYLQVIHFYNYSEINGSSIFFYLIVGYGRAFNYKRTYKKRDLARSNIAANAIPLLY